MTNDCHYVEKNLFFNQPNCKKKPLLINQLRNPDGEENQSAADDGASLFEEFSDSLTELRVGQKLYQRFETVFATVDS